MRATGTFRARAALALLLVAVVVAFHAPILRAAAAVLVADDPLEPASAIVVLGGEVPFRHFEAAELYQRGWGPKVVLSHEVETENAVALKALGIHQPTNTELGEQVLLRLGVPPEALVMLQRPVATTADELQQVYDVVAERGKPIILITTRTHTRRVSLLWREISRDSTRGLVRPTSSDPFQVDGWWRRRSDILTLTREYMSLANEMLSRPVRS